jgi:hypothetical protein
MRDLDLRGQQINRICSSVLGHGEGPRWRLSVVAQSCNISLPWLYTWIQWEFPTSKEAYLGEDNPTSVKIYRGPEA